MKEVIIDTLVDGVKLLPFLYLTYLLMEYLAHRAGDKMRTIVKNSGKFGPVLGALLGLLPQCGFSAAASGFYAGRVISMGTLIAVYLSTSDEMIPVMISSQVPVLTIVKILGAKLLFGMVVGVLIDLIFRPRQPKIRVGRSMQQNIDVFCQNGNCGCGQSRNLFLAALKHTGNVFLFLLLISFVINVITEYVGMDFLSNSIFQKLFVGELIAALIGFIPNCAASVALTQFYLDGVMSAGAMISGLLTGAGVGILVLFRLNRNLKDNLKILGILYAAGVLCGTLVQLLGF